ncbi:TonB-dependent receptor [Robertkochia flava]|uniref:TonB-dependent receptor n=1 Tax=Robertkochia flava TaxID=3447986 RepID=UPI001CCEDF78|nr:carboxypeptidase-like regulatory domain-containing protein [Robertkochia marina]
MRNSIFLKFIFSFLLFPGVIFQASAQETAPLKSVLITLESRYECRFSYADELIAVFEVIPPSPVSTLQEAMNDLEQQTGLVFKTLDNRIITIAPSIPYPETLCGTVTDMENAPLEGAEIRTLNQRTFTNSDGYFRLSRVDQSDTLRITYLGYKALELPVSSITKSDCGSYRMQGEINPLQEITLYNFLARGISLKADGSLEVDASQFGILPGLTEADPLQTVQTLPGINSNDETVTNINIRGGSHDQNYITWNGIPMYQSGHFFSYISAFNPDLVNETTLVKNGTSAAYTGGVSGSILMNSGQQTDSIFSVSAGLNLINAHAALNIPMGKKASLKVAGRRSFNDLFRSRAYQNYFNQAFQNTEVLTNRENVIEASDSFRFFDLGGVLNYTPGSRDHLKAGFLMMDNSFSFLENAFVNNVEQSRESSSTQRNSGGFFNYQRSWNRRISSTLNTYHVQYTLEGRNADILQDQLFLQNNKVSETGIKLEGKLEIYADLLLKTGYELNHTRVQNTDTLQGGTIATEIDQDITRHAFYTEAFWVPWVGSSLRPGIRLNYLKQPDLFLAEPRLNLVQALGNSGYLDLSAEIKSQVITQEVDLQTDFLGVENRRWFLSQEPERPVLKSRQLSVGYRYNTGPWKFHSEAYFKAVEGLNARSQGFTNAFEGINALGNYTSKGLDLVINHQSDAFNGWISYSLAETTYDFEDLYPEQFPSNFNINHAVSSGLSYSWRRLISSIGLNWRSGLPTTLPVQGNEVVNGAINYEAPNSRVLPYYQRIDASINYTLRLNGNGYAKLGVAVWNLFDQENEISRFYRFTDINFPQRISRFGLERTINLFVKFEF